MRLIPGLSSNGDSPFFTPISVFGVLKKGFRDAIIYDLENNLKTRSLG